MTRGMEERRAKRKLRRGLKERKEIQTSGVMEEGQQRGYRKEDGERWETNG